MLSYVFSTDGYAIVHVYHTIHFHIWICKDEQVIVFTPSQLSSFH